MFQSSGPIDYFVEVRPQFIPYGGVTMPRKNFENEDYLFSELFFINNLRSSKFRAREVSSQVFEKMRRLVDRPESRKEELGRSIRQMILWRHDSNEITTSAAGSCNFLQPYF